MQNLDINFAIVSYDCNFWAMAALSSLIQSIELFNKEFIPNIFIIHNKKTTKQIEYFKEYFKNSNIPIINIVAYEDVFKGIGNYYDTYDPNYNDRFLRLENKPHYFICQYPMVLCWLIKYFLPEGKYLFIDHDCVVNDSFIGNLFSSKEELFKNKILLFPNHDRDYISLTSPMFFVNTEIRKYLQKFPDVGWVKNIVGEIFRQDKITKHWEISNFERNLKLINFDDCLLNVVRYILNIDSNFEDNIEITHWGYNEHAWESGKNLEDENKIGLFMNYFIKFFKIEYFKEDIMTETFQFFRENLIYNGLEPYYENIINLKGEEKEFAFFMREGWFPREPFKFINFK